MNEKFEKRQRNDQLPGVRTRIELSPGNGARERLVLRPPAFADLETVVDFLNQTWGALVGADEFSVEEIRFEWQEPGFNPQTDLRVLVDSNEQLLAYCEFYPREPYVRNFSWVQIHPDWRTEPVGELLYDWVEARAHEAVLKAPEGARVVLLAPVASNDDFTAGFLRSRGYRLIRRFYRMLIEMETPPLAPDWPPGLDGKTPMIVRTMRAGEEVAVVEAVRESFRDHWGFVEQPLESELELWRHRMEEPDFDPGLWFIAEDEGQIAGISLCRTSFTGHPDWGWVSTLGVLRPWRKRGLATALLLHSFGEYYRRGYRQVGLGVDAESLTGATRLYEKVGMHVAFEFHQYEWELQPGVELGTMEAGSH